MNSMELLSLDYFMLHFKGLMVNEDSMIHLFDIFDFIIVSYVISQNFNCLLKYGI